MKKGREKNKIDESDGKALIYKRKGSYLYGSISKQIVANTNSSGDEDGSGTIHWGSPFIIGRYLDTGEEIIYGSLHNLVEKIYDLIFSIGEKLNEIAKGDPRNKKLVSRVHVLREESLERDLLVFVLYTRILGEKISLLDGKVRLYDNEDKDVGDTNLKDLFDILIHHRYLVLRNGFIRDVFSDKKMVDGSESLGSGILLLEVLNAVMNSLHGLKIKDFCDCLESEIDDCDSKSDRDMVFLSQNLHSLSYILRQSLRENTNYPNLIFNIFKDEISGSGDNYYKQGDVIRISLKFRGGLSFKPTNFNINEINVGVDLVNRRVEKNLDYKEFFKLIKEFYGDGQFYKCVGIEFVSHDLP